MCDRLDYFNTHRILDESLGGFSHAGKLSDVHIHSSEKRQFVIDIISSFQANVWVLLLFDGLRDTSKGQ